MLATYKSSSMMQCAAVRTYFGDIIDPPQNALKYPFVGFPIATNHGYESR